MRMRMRRGTTGGESAKGEAPPGPSLTAARGGVPARAGGGQALPDRASRGSGACKRAPDAQRGDAMMGRKVRSCTPVLAVSLDALVPADHFYRHLERVLDLAFVRDLVGDCYAGCGRPSVDPVVFFKLQLVLFFEGVRSERLLMRLVADRLSVRWFLGYNLDEPLPDHSSLTRIRTRYGVEVVRRFFAVIVDQCQQAGLGLGRRPHLHGTPPPGNSAL